MKRALVLAWIGCGAVMSNRAEVVSVVFGSNPNAQTIPFEAGSGRMQQLYPSSLFDAVAAEQILITGISFRAAQPFVTDVTGMRMLMAQTDAQTTSVDFSANLGGGSVEVLARGNYTVNASSSSVVIPMTKGFVYDRTQGNLIVDIHFAGSSQPGRLDFSYGQNVNLMAFNGDPDAALGNSFQAGGLRTEFTFTPVPEPSGVAMWMTVGMVGWILLGGRRRTGGETRGGCVETRMASRSVTRAQDRARHKSSEFDFSLINCIKRTLSADECRLRAAKGLPVSL